MPSHTLGRPPAPPRAPEPVARRTGPPAQGSSLPPAPIDPRIRQRRITVRRHQGRRRLHRLAMTVLLVVLVAAAVAATRSPLLDVDHIEVRGATRASSTAVRAASRVAPGELMVKIDPEIIARRVAAIPWVGDVRVWRRWPATLRIAVSERRPLAQIEAAGGGWVLVDSTGRVLERQAHQAPGLVVLEGSTPAPPGAGLGGSYEAALRLARAIPASLAPLVASLTRPAGEVGIRLAGGGVVRLGGVDRLRSKLVALEALLAQPDRRCFVVIDLGAPTAPALTRVPGCA